MKSRSKLALGAAAALVLALSVLVAPSAATAAQASASLKVTSIVAAAGGTVIAGQPITVRGTASPSLIGQTVKLQRWDGKQWVKLAPKARVSSNGTFKITASAEKYGSVKYRVVYGGSTKVAPVNSSYRSVTVYRWKYLSQMTPKVENSYRTTFEGIWINGKKYPKSGYFTSSGSVSFDLKRQCLTLAVTLGVPDYESFTSQRQVRIKYDGRVVYEQTLTGGTEYPVKESVSGILELGFESVYAWSGTDAALGSAKVLCRF